MILFHFYKFKITLWNDALKPIVALGTLYITLLLYEDCRLLPVDVSNSRWAVSVAGRIVRATSYVLLPSHQSNDRAPKRTIKIYFEKGK